MPWLTPVLKLLQGLISAAKKSKNKTSLPYLPSPSITVCSLDFLRSVKEANKLSCKMWVMTCFLIWKLISVHKSNRKMLKCSVVCALHFLETFFSFQFLVFVFFFMWENRHFLKVKWLVHCLCLSCYIFMFLFYFCFNIEVSDANQCAAVYLIIS